MSKALTAKGIEAVTPGNSRREIPDGLLPGLYLVVQPSGAKSWAIRYRHAGKPRKLTLGPVAPKLDGPEPEPRLDVPLTLAGARTVARDQLQQIAAGRDPGADKVALKRSRRDPEAIDSSLFENVARLFVERYAKPKNRSWRESARLLGLTEDDDGKLVLRDGAATEWTGKRIEEITRKDVIELLDSIVDRGAPIVANRTLAAVRKLFNWTVERGILDSSPAAGVKPPASAKSRDRVLEDHELRAVWHATDALRYPFGPLVKLLILTGQRREEVTGMRWSELTLEGEEPTWTIPRGRMKRDKAHVVPLSAPAVAILESLPTIEGSDFVFTTTGVTAVSGHSKAKTMLDAAVVKGARKVVEEAGGDPDTVKPLPHWTYHDLRRTLASGMARLGINLPVIEKVLAHESGSFGGIVGVYQRHSFAEEKRVALDAWGRFVLDLIADQTEGAA